MLWGTDTPFSVSAVSSSSGWQALKSRGLTMDGSGGRLEAVSRLAEGRHLILGPVRRHSHHLSSPPRRQLIAGVALVHPVLIPRFITYSLSHAMVSEVTGNYVPDFDPTRPSRVTVALVNFGVPPSHFCGKPPTYCKAIGPMHFLKPSLIEVYGDPDPLKFVFERGKDNLSIWWVELQFEAGLEFLQNFSSMGNLSFCRA
ncbi:hypothetical protein C8F04DRAFT_1193174 [Mycena alexandri]|uniref:Uncharacterized protein n=1 Tax=Mycena alexandri TaxID=1745969 RepID=A0AAD6S9W6_9AGAR|nr:hypothetical protein C8F04DRAFT_1193174 [Mycena alexandri]